MWGVGWERRQYYKLKLEQLTWSNLCSSSVYGYVSWQIQRLCSPLHQIKKGKFRHSGVRNKSDMINITKEKSGKVHLFFFIKTVGSSPQRAISQIIVMFQGTNRQAFSFTLNYIKVGAKDFSKGMIKHHTLQEPSAPF